MNRLKRGTDSENSQKSVRSVDCESGVFSAMLYKNATKGMKPKQKVQSRAFQELWLDLAGEISYRHCAKMLNRFLHRGPGSCVSPTTLEERVESFGKSLSEGYVARADGILKSFNIHDGIITTESSVPSSILNPELPAVIDEKQIRQLITDYNRGRECSTKLKYGDQASNIESSTQKCCYISIDDIGVKYQKPSRKDKRKKDRKYVENTVIHIQAEDRQYTLTAIGMDKAFKLLVAFLLENRLMEDYRLVFFTDGAVCIRDNINKYFGFRQHTIILDWLHLEKKCYQLMSMAIKGTNAEKDDIKKTLCAILWTGRFDKAIKHLDGIKKANIKSDKNLDEVKAYIKRKSPNLTCYALRSKLGLRISSNRVEKANDMVVASRQKHNGMSWSIDGSGALATITAARINGELRFWIKDKTIPFKFAC